MLECDDETMTQDEALPRFISDCDPSVPSAAGAYVPRTPAVAERLSRAIIPARARVMLIGQTGVGKTTELLAFERSEQASRLVVRPPVDVYLDLDELGWHEILVFAALWAAKEFDATGHALARKLADAVHPPTSTPLLSDAFTVNRGGPPSPTALQRFRNEYGRVRETIGLGRAQYWDLATSVFEAIAEHVGKEVVLVVDGLEKMGDRSAERIFYDERKYLHDLPCRAVVTAPLALSFQPYFGDIEESFLAIERVRAVSCQKDEAGFDFFRAIAQARGAAAVMDPDIIDEAVSWGGGLPRQFLQLLATAATQALTDGSPKVEKEAFARARQRVSERWQYQLGPADFLQLGLGIHALQSKTKARLLRLGALIEYEKPDGSLRIGINPLVGALVKRRMGEAAQ
ncbi:MAG: hypothetical protein AAB426_10870 [Myxococcota bacterium]